MFRVLILIQTLIILCLSYSTDPSKPNVLFILGDDWGWNDFSFAGATNIETPNLDYEKANGLYLFHYYTLHICTPARASLLSGKYASRIGMQHGVVSPSSGWAIPRYLTLLPERLKALGYNTHMLGKWHLGFPSWKDVPMQRGFDSFLGYYNGEESYFFKDFTYEQPNKSYSGYDFRLNNDPFYDKEYSTWLYANRTINLLQHEKHNEDPFFIYAAFQAIHNPVEPPPEYFETFKDCGQFEDRCKISAEAYVFDEAFGKIIANVKDMNMWENTLIVFANDNGGSVGIFANNWPLRGQKSSYWDGGFRVHAFITGGYLPENRRGETINDLFHVTDWYPTILSFIGDNEFVDTYDFDGIDQSSPILYGEQSKRNEILLCIDTSDCSYDYCAAVIYKNFKLVQGKYVAYTDYKHSGWTPLHDQQQFGEPTVDCGGPVPHFVADTTKCPWNGEACLYNLADDPCEYRDVKHEYPEVYQHLLGRFEYHAETSIDPWSVVYPDDECALSDPENFGGYWTPWHDTLEDVLAENEEKRIEREAEEMERANEMKDSKRDAWYKRWNFLSCVL